ANRASWKALQIGAESTMSNNTLSLCDIAVTAFQEETQRSLKNSALQRKNVTSQSANACRLAMKELDGQGVKHERLQTLKGYDFFKG
ncbi:MAG TPA: hypothetical protein VGK01_14355, partial [Candidatus Angelobacter sp.]